MRRAASGFTLIEVMVVVAIVAILAAIALPSYQAYVTRSKLPQAFSALSGMSLAAQQYYQDNRTYAASTSPSATTCPMTLPTSEYFQFSCANVTVSTITFQAVGTSSDLTAGHAITFTLDQAGNRATTQVPTGWVLPSNASTCWVRDQSGSC